MRHIASHASDADLKVLAGFRYALRRFLRFSEESAMTVGLTPQHYLALLAIHGHGPSGRVTVGVLADRMQVRPNSAVGLADRLVRRGLVNRLHSRDDRRERHLELTSRGERMLRQVAGLNRGELTRLRADLIRLLRKLGH